MRISSPDGSHTKKLSWRLYSQLKLNTEATITGCILSLCWNPDPLYQEQTEALMTSGAAISMVLPVFVLSSKKSCKWMIDHEKLHVKNYGNIFKLKDHIISLELHWGFIICMSKKPANTNRFLAFISLQSESTEARNLAAFTHYWAGRANVYFIRARR